MDKILRFEITDKCNLKCEMCWSTQWQHKEMTYQQVERIINDYKALGGNTVVLTSREPLLSSNLKKIIELCKSKNVDVKLLTNGTLIDKAMARFIVEESGISFVSVSVHGERSVHDGVTGVAGSLQKTVKGIENINYYKNLFGKKYPELRITAVITEQLLNSLKYVLSLAKENNTQLRLQHYMWHSEKIKELHKKELRDSWGISDGIIEGFNSTCNINANYVIEKLDECRNICLLQSIDFQDYPKLKNEEIIKWYSKDAQNVFERAYCKHVKNSIRLRANGQVSLCQYIDIPIGNLATSTWEDILNSNVYNAIGEQLESGKLFPLCNRCCHVEVADYFDTVPANSDI